MDGNSLTPQQEKINALKQIMPEVFAEGKIDWGKLKATLGEDVHISNERYVLNWAGKSEAFKTLQAPTTKTLIPAKEESVNFDDTEHIFIEGENLEVLKVLQKSYFGKVKMIYIDPPYNTGNDSFIYPDKFSETKAEYEKRVGDKDEEGYMTKDGMFRKNSKENGQYHSNWLNMMMPRLYLAKNLLKQDGVIFISIDDNEEHNLRLLMNEIFGEENFLNLFIWLNNSAGRQIQGSGAATTKEYILCYSKDYSSISQFVIDNEYAKNLMPDIYKGFNFEIKEDEIGKFIITHELNNGNSIFNENTRPNLVFDIFYNPENGMVRTGIVNSELPKHFVRISPKNISNGHNKFYAWRWSREKIKNESYDLEFVKNKEKWAVYTKRRNFNLTSLKDTITNITTVKGAYELNSLEFKQFFDYPKPVDLVKLFMKIALDNSSIILDFFSGSGTTAHAVMALNAEDGGNRKCISVQLPEKCDEKSEAYKAGYKTIADIAKERIRRAGNKINDELVLQISELKSKIQKLELELQTDHTIKEIHNLKSKISNLKSQDTGFKVLKLSDSNFKQWQQNLGKDKQALEAQMKLFVDPVATTATTENMVYELMLKSGKDLNSTIEKKDGYFTINENELILMLEKATQEIIDAVIASKPQKVICLDKLFKSNDQLKTNASLQMKDAGIEFKTI